MSDSLLFEYGIRNGMAAEMLSRLVSSVKNGREVGPVCAVVFERSDAWITGNTNHGYRLM
jgi:hypothetical protein